jgi:hypothetical protein
MIHLLLLVFQCCVKKKNDPIASIHHQCLLFRFHFLFLPFGSFLPTPFLHLYFPFASLTFSHVYFSQPLPFSLLLVLASLKSLISLLHSSNKKGIIKFIIRKYKQKYFVHFITFVSLPFSLKRLQYMWTIFSFLFV